MCTLGVQGIRVVFDTFSCSRTCTSWVHGCACVSADVTRLDLAHMFDATQEHRLREMLTFFQYVHTRSPRNESGFRRIFLLTHLHVLGTRMRMCLCWCYSSWSCTHVWCYARTSSSGDVNVLSICAHSESKELEWFSTHFLAHALARLGYTDAHVSLLMLLVLILHMFDATQEHRLREMLTFFQYVHTRGPRN